MTELYKKLVKGLGFLYSLELQQAPGRAAAARANTLSPPARQRAAGAESRRQAGP